MIKTIAVLFTVLALSTSAFVGFDGPWRSFKLSYCEIN